MASITLGLGALSGISAMLMLALDAPSCAIMVIPFVDDALGGRHRCVGQLTSHANFIGWAIAVFYSMLILSTCIISFSPLVVTWKSCLKTLGAEISVSEPIKQVLSSDSDSEANSTTVLSSLVHFKVNLKQPRSMSSDTHVIPKAATIIKDEFTEEPPVKTVPSSTTDSDTDEKKFDITQNIYGGIKTLWGCGKNVNFVKDVIGAVEGVAKNLPVDLEVIDKETKPKLVGLDNFLNPNISKVMEFLSPVIKKSEEILKPFAMNIFPSVLGTLGIKPPPSLLPPDSTSMPEGKGKSLLESKNFTKTPTLQ